MRAFLALGLPEETRERLAVRASKLAGSLGAGARATRASNLHATVRFLGPVTDVPALVETFSSARLGGPLALHCRGESFFGPGSKARSVYAELTGEVDRFSELASRCDALLEGLGFAPDPKARVPHVTLVRLKPPRSVGSLESSSDYGPLDGSELLLFSSELNPAGSIYRVEARFPLRG